MNKSVIYTFPNGETLELFYIGTLAYELGRASDTIRKWEVAGYIPDTCFKDNRGCRLYSREQIDVIVNAAVESKIMQGRAMNETLFPRKCFEGMERLRIKYEEKNNGKVTEKADSKDGGSE